MRVCGLALDSGGHAREEHRHRSPGGHHQGQRERRGQRQPLRAVQGPREGARDLLSDRVGVRLMQAGGGVSGGGSVDVAVSFQMLVLIVAVTT